jgi:hypothetical protein
MDQIQKAIQANLIRRQDNLDAISKGRVLPVGTIKERSNGNFIKTADGWKYHSQAGTSVTQPDAEPSERSAKLTALVASLAETEDFTAKMDLIVAADITDPEKAVELTAGNLSEVIAYMEGKGIAPSRQSFNLSEELANTASGGGNGLPEVPVKERWEAYKLFIDMVATGEAKSAIAYGTGGVGKTYNMMEVFKEHNMREFHSELHLPGEQDYDFVKITGKSTPTHMYKALYEHNGKVIVFDDCDSVLKDDTSINILKGALDTTGDGTVSYGSGRKIKDSDGEEIPQRFSFNGRVMFISNLTPKEMPQPLRSRAYTINLTMTADETITMMKDIVQVMPFQDNRGNPIEVSPEDRTAAIDFLSSVKDKIDIGDLNVRTLGQIAMIKKRTANNPSVNWKQMATAMLS